MRATKTKVRDLPRSIVLAPDALKAFENPDEPDTGESYFSLRGVQYVSTISLRAILSGPQWSPALPLPLRPDIAATSARGALRRLVKDDNGWILTEITMQRLRNFEPERWFFVIEFTRETGPSDLQGVVRVYVGFSGRVGTVKRMKT